MESFNTIKKAREALKDKVKMFDYEEIDDKIGYVVGFLYPDESWGER